LVITSLERGINNRLDIYCIIDILEAENANASLVYIALAHISVSIY